MGAKKEKKPEKRSIILSKIRIILFNEYSISEHIPQASYLC